MTSAEKFWDKIAPKYAKSSIKNIDAYNQTLDATKAYLSADDAALEIGCGTGSTALLLSDSVKHITASDISANMIGIAQSKAEEQGVSNVSFVQGNVFDATLEPESFDVILAFNLLHLVEDLPGTLKRLHSLLRPQGRFISKSPCLAEQTRLWAVPLFIAQKLGFAPYVHLMTFDQLERDITSAPFQITKAKIFEGSSMNRFIVAEKV